MKDPSSSSLSAFALLSLSITLMSCGGPIEPLPEREEAVPQQLEVQEPIEFTAENYPSRINEGATPINSLRRTITENALDDRGRPARTWYGFSKDDPYPVMGNCTPDSNFMQTPAKLSSLPATVRGVVTIYPRYFIKSSICAQDERFYGSFFIQDGSGGMLVLRDSRTAGFTFGDVVEFEVNGLMKLFDYKAMLSIDQIRVVTDEYVDEPGQKVPIYAEEVTRAFNTSDQGKVMRVTGVVAEEATNNNFNLMRLESEDGQIEWLVALDRELGQRNPDWKAGDKLEVTGPVLNSFGIKIVVMSYGQVRKLD